jgi:hypothetical protein
VDAYARGRDIPSASSEARSRVGEFAFANLLEALPDKALLVLESLRLNEVQDRPQICAQTGLGLDEVADAIGSLSRTSLIIRREGQDGEIYKLSDVISDFLLVNPDAIKVRESLLEKTRALKNRNIEVRIDQEEYGIRDHQWPYLDADVPHGLKAKLGSARPTLLRRNPDVEHVIEVKR